MKTFIKTLTAAGLGLIGSLGAAQAAPYDAAGYGILPGGCYGDSTCSAGRSANYRPTSEMPIGCDFGRDGGFARHDYGATSHGRYDVPTSRGRVDRRQDFDRSSAWKNDWLRSTSTGVERYRHPRSGDDFGFDRRDHGGYGRSTNMFEPWPGRSGASSRLEPVRSR